jgi:hypothetical protein
MPADTPKVEGGSPAGVRGHATREHEIRFRRQMIFNEIALPDLFGGGISTYMRPHHL